MYCSASKIRTVLNFTLHSIPFYFIVVVVFIHLFEAYLLWIVAQIPPSFCFYGQIIYHAKIDQHFFHQLHFGFGCDKEYFCKALRHFKTIFVVVFVLWNAILNGRINAIHHLLLSKHCLRLHQTDLNASLEKIAQIYDFLQSKKKLSKILTRKHKTPNKN